VRNSSPKSRPLFSRSILTLVPMIYRGKCFIFNTIWRGREIERKQ
jgi:hypothetical protein